MNELDTETINLWDSVSISGQECLSSCEQQQASLSVVHGVPPLPTCRKIELEALREKEKLSVDSKFDWKMIELDTELIVMRRNVSENLPKGSFKVSKPSEGKEGAFENEYSSDEEVAQSDWSEEDILKKKPVKRKPPAKKANFNKKKRTPQTKKSSLNEKVFILPDKADLWQSWD